MLGRESACERQRLAVLEATFDPWTIRALEGSGPRAGHRCLEIGAGSGSIARWLRARVGPTGHVVATDIDTRFLDSSAAPNLEVRRHDILTDPIETGAFDLVHARFVLEHIEGRDRALERMVGALKPGGAIIIEDGDHGSMRQTAGGHPGVFDRGWQACLSVLTAAGFDPSYARRLETELRRRGLTGVQVEARPAFEWGGPLPQTAIYTIAFEGLREEIGRSGRLTSLEAEEFFALIRSDGFRAIGPTTFAGAGRKPR